MVFVTLLVSLMWLTGIAVGGPRPGPEAARPHVVAEGETLWEIARRLVGPQGDPRPLIEEIREANGLGTAVLVEGQSLVLPAR